MDMVRQAGRPSMKDIWMETAIQLSNRSTCTRLNVGCVVSSKDLRRVLANGYNGGAAGINDPCLGTDPCCLHSEINALITCGSHEKDKVMFVTVLPCKQCARAMVNSGFSEVYYLHDHEKKDSVLIFEAVGIKLTHYENNKA